MYDRIKIYLYICLPYSTNTWTVPSCRRRVQSPSSPSSLSSLSLLLLLLPSTSSSVTGSFFTCLFFSSRHKLIAYQRVIFCWYFFFADLSFILYFWTIKKRQQIFRSSLFLFIDYYYFNDDNTKEIHTSAQIMCVRAHFHLYLFEFFI